MRSRGGPPVASAGKARAPSNSNKVANMDGNSRRTQGRMNRRRHQSFQQYRFMISHAVVVFIFSALAPPVAVQSVGNLRENMMLLQRAARRRHVSVHDSSSSSAQLQVSLLEASLREQKRSGAASKPSDVANNAPPDPGVASEAVASEVGAEAGNIDYQIPYYPLPPTPTLAPPPTMPFAKIDWPHENAFTPPSLEIQSTAEAGMEAGLEAGNLFGKSGEEASEAGWNVPYEAPPMSESETGKKDVWRQHAGAGDKRKDSVNPYCQYCQAYMGTVMKGGANADEACQRFPKTSQATCKTVAATLELKDQAQTVLMKGCIDRTGEMPIIKGENECPPLVACNLMEADNGTPLCGLVRGTWGSFRILKDKDGRPINEQFPDGNIDGGYPLRKRDGDWPSQDSLSAYSPPPGLGAIEGASNPYCEVCMEAIHYMQKEPESTVHDLCKLMPQSMYTDCMWVAKPLKTNPDAKKIVESGCKDHTGKEISDAKPCPGEIACNLIEDGTGGPLCGSYPGQWGSVEGAAPGGGASSEASEAGAEATLF